MRTDESASTDGYKEQFVYDEECDCHLCDMVRDKSA